MAGLRMEKQTMPRCDVIRTQWGIQVVEHRVGKGSMAQNLTKWEAQVGSSAGEGGEHRLHLQTWWVGVVRLDTEIFSSSYTSHTFGDFPKQFFFSSLITFLRVIYCVSLFQKTKPRLNVILVDPRQTKETSEVGLPDKIQGA